jgi:large subunit ribosomal protein L4
MSKLTVCNTKGDRVGEVNIADDLLETKKGMQAIFDSVKAHRAKDRAGTASTKTQRDVSGGGAKPWKQKGTGRARAGSIRSPIWRGGGILFGPQPRSFELNLPRKVQQVAFRRALSDKIISGELLVVDHLEIAEPKTKSVAAILKNLKAHKGALLVTEPIEKNLRLAARNIPNVDVVGAKQVSTYQILRYPVVIVSQGAMATLEGRLKKKSRRPA